MAQQATKFNASCENYFDFNFTSRNTEAIKVAPQDSSSQDDSNDDVSTREKFSTFLSK